MKEPYREGVAHHPDPEPCAGPREGMGEALIGARTGGTSSCEINPIQVPTSLHGAEGNTGGSAREDALAPIGPGAVVASWHVRKLHVRNPGDPAVARQCDGLSGREANPKGVRLR